MSIYLHDPRFRSLITDEDLFFEMKEDNRGKYWYRKLIADQKHNVSDQTGYKAKAPKHTGKWYHEDDFATKYICNAKRNVFIAEYNHGLDIDEVFIPNVGWKSSFETIKFLTEQKVAS